MAERQTFKSLIAANKRNSMILLFIMLILLVGLGAVFGGAYGNYRFGLLCGVGLAAFMFLVSWFMGRDIVMAVSGAQEIEKSDAPQLFNVVEEMSIAAGIPMPKVYIMNEAAPNAFATGSSPENAAVAITTGLLEKLNREELQGVMAHEIGHIRNFDIRFSMLMAVLAGAIVLLSDIFLRTMFWTGGGSRRRSDRDNGGGIGAILVIVGLVLAILSPIITAILQMAASRQREYLADATAVEFTRNPEGLASALQKLSEDKSPMKVSNATASLFIVNPKLSLRGGANKLFSTHPPIEERVARLRALQG